MKARLLALLLFLLLIAWPAAAQSPAAPQTIPSEAPTPLQMNTHERQFFELGLTLSQGAFAYAELAKHATQVGLLGRLASVAKRNRMSACENLTQTLTLMQAMNAPTTALSAIGQVVQRLAKPLPLASNARPLALFNTGAAQTLSSLNEFETLSSLPEDPALKKWVTSPDVPDSAQVWYGEGEIAALAEIASAQQMPELLPPAQQIATDLRGLRDWLSLRLPDTPSPEQTALKETLEAFLHDAQQTAIPGRKSHKLLTLSQLQTLGSISRLLQAQILGIPATPRKLADAR